MQLAQKWAEHKHGSHAWATLSLCEQWRSTADALDALRRAHAAAIDDEPKPDGAPEDIDPGQATPERLRLICDEQRADDPEQARYDTDRQILADTRNTLTLPGVHVRGGFPVEDDGSEYAAALIAFLTRRT